MNWIYTGKARTNKKWGVLSIVRARVLSEIVETSTMSALTNAPVRQMPANNLFVGFFPPLRMAIRVRDMRTRKPRIGGIA
jgi:hypothetical protein